MEDEPGHKSICDWVNDRFEELKIKTTRIKMNDRITSLDEQLCGLRVEFARRKDELTIKDNPCLDQVDTKGDGTEQDDIDKASNVLRAMWHHADAWQREAIIIILKELAQ